MVQLTRCNLEPQSITVDVDPTIFEDLTIKYKQTGRVVVEKKLEDITINERTLTYVLTPEETARFNTRDPVWIQIKGLLGEENPEYSNVVEADVIDVL